VLENILKTTLLPLYPEGSVDAGEVGLPITRDNIVLPCGIYGRYIGND
jgi:23S rRNA (cytosine1962-C5)-methyltransferase